MAIRAVCFDVGGVVARISYRWDEMLDRCGLPVPRHVVENPGVHSMPSFDAYQAGALTDKQYLHDLACHLGGLTYEQAERVHRSMLIEPYPGILEIVLEMTAHGLITGCLSNTNRPHWQELAASGRFPAIQAMGIRLASHEIDAAKPDPRAFVAFEEEAACEPGAILLFDDSKANCEAAEGLGWKAVRIDPYRDPGRQIRKRMAGIELCNAAG